MSRAYIRTRVSQPLGPGIVVHVPGMVVHVPGLHACNPSTQEGRQKQKCNFDSNLGYLVRLCLPHTNKTPEFQFHLIPNMLHGRCTKMFSVLLSLFLQVQWNRHKIHNQGTGAETSSAMRNPSPQISPHLLNKNETLIKTPQSSDKGHTGLQRYLTHTTCSPLLLLFLCKIWEQGNMSLIKQFVIDANRKTTPQI